MTYKIYNLHDILVIAVSNDISFTNEIDAHLGFFFVSDNVTQIDNADVVINSFESFNHNFNFKEIVFDDYVFDNNFLIRKSVGLGINILGERHLYYFSKLFLPINLIIQLSLLKKGYSFIHCAAFNFNGKSFLLPAFGGVGKTSIMSFFAAKGAKIFGDDLCIIGNGKLYAYPQDMSIYDYHCRIFANLPKYVHEYFFTRKVVLTILTPLIYLGPKAKKLANFLLARYYGECLNVPLTSVFGDDCIANPLTIDYIIKLNKKSSLNSIKMGLSKTDSKNLSQFCTSVVINEWNNYFNQLLLIDACSGSYSAFSLNLFLKQTNDIILKSFSNLETYEVDIDSKDSAEAINYNFNTILSNL